MRKPIDELKSRLQEVDDLEKAGAVLNWDQAVYMPTGGAAGRGRQTATLERLAHEKFTDPAVGEVLDAIDPVNEAEVALVRVTRRDYDRAINVPAEFVERQVAHNAAKYQVWEQARPANDFAAVQPYLEKTLEFSREYADFFPGYEHPADPLIDISDEGMKAATVRKLFGELREALVPLVVNIGERDLANDSCLRENFPEAQQLAFGELIIRKFGYDFNRGRQDKTAHPFMIRFGSGDCRITTRLQENYLGEALFSTLHEAGHAMYEQGVSSEYDGTPLGQGATSGVHESQSRLWENQVGRSLGFWKHYYPQLQREFPDQLGSVDLEIFYRAINKVQPSLIRTDSDEVTYNLHVMIRFELELAMLEGSLSVGDLPGAWRDLYKKTLGVAVPDDRDGVLQDVHWYYSNIGGMFQCYTLGNIMAAQIYAAAEQNISDLPGQIEQGDFACLLAWLKENIYQHGRTVSAEQLLQRCCGGAISIDPFLSYLKNKFGPLYNLDD
jgi:carboxypeptidase Taq